MLFFLGSQCNFINGSFCFVSSQSPVCCCPKGNLKINLKKKLKNISKGFGGISCSTILNCHINTCLNGGTCEQNSLGHLICRCPPG